MPRWIEIVLAASGLALVSPLLLAAALAIRISGDGPILFRQERIGQGGHPFAILKFRTMVCDAEIEGGRLTVGGRDPRVTRLGYWLRRCKLDEIPQLWNVVRGEMSLVGPRPEVPEYVRLWDETQRAALLAVAPGITDPASIEYRDESEVLAGVKDPERLYIEEIMPRKLAMNAEYLESRTTRRDFGVIAETVRKAVLRT